MTQCGGFQPVCRGTLGHHRVFKTCNTWLVSQGPALSSLRLSNRKWHQPTQEPPGVNESKLYLFFGQISKNIYFLVCHRISVISLCVPRDEKGWKIIGMVFISNIIGFSKHYLLLLSSSARELWSLCQICWLELNYFKYYLRSLKTPIQL